MAATPMGRRRAAGLPMVAVQAPCCAIGSEATAHGTSEVAFTDCAYSLGSCPRAAWFNGTINRRFGGASTPAASRSPRRCSRVSCSSVMETSSVSRCAAITASSVVFCFAIAAARAVMEASSAAMRVSKSATLPARSSLGVSGCSGSSGVSGSSGGSGGVGGSVCPPKRKTPASKPGKQQVVRGQSHKVVVVQI